MVSQTVSVGNTTISLDLLLNQGKDTAIQAVADLYVTWPIFAVGAATAIVISFFWLFLAQYVVGMFVWISMIAINLIAVFSSILLYLYWNSRKVAFANGTLPSGIATANTPWGNFTQEISFFSSKSTVTQNEVNISFGVFITSCVCTVILLLVTIAMIKRIRLAIQIINETSKAFVKMPGISIVYFM
jgi:solute carrier family 44 protein 1 (choline transporter-like protein)/choline transporter-like protein 2/4/5